MSDLFITHSLTTKRIIASSYTSCASELGLKLATTGTPRVDSTFSTLAAETGDKCFIYHGGFFQYPIPVADLIRVCSAYNNDW